MASSLLLLLTLVSCVVSDIAIEESSPSSDLDLIATRIALQQQPPFSQLSVFDAAVSLNASFLLAGGNFSDLDYTYCVNALWPAMLHPERLGFFAAAYVTAGSVHFHNATLLSAIHTSLAWWLDWNGVHHHDSTNWWMNQVGVPGFLGRLGLVLQSADALLPSELAGIVLSTHLADTYRGGCEPTNCAWLAGNVFLGGLLERNITLVNRTLTDIFSTIALRNPFSPSDPSGIKEDNSIMMHGSLLYSGGYGMVWAATMINLLSATAGTVCCALPTADPRWTLFSAVMLDGSLRMMHFGDGLPPYGPASWDISALGRNVVRPYGDDPGNAAGQAVVFSPFSLSSVGGPRSEEFLQFSALLNGTGGHVSPSFLSRSTFFYIAGYATHTFALPWEEGRVQALSWSSSAFAASTRNKRSEITNNENLLGYHLSENAMWTMLNGTEFLDIGASLDWQRIPGTTVLPFAHYSSADVGDMGMTEFVGGASDSVTTVMANDFIAPNNKGLSYRKLTAFLNTSVLQLTANISSISTTAAAIVYTNIEQRRAGGGGACVQSGSSAPPPIAMGGVYTSSGGATTPLPVGNFTLDPSVWWIFEGGIGYVLLDRSPTKMINNQNQSLPTLHVASILQTGNWQTIGADQGTVTCAVFSIWLEHAVPVIGVNTAYAISPGVDLAVWAGNGIGSAAALVASLNIVSNDAHLQAILYANTTLAVVAYDDNTSVSTQGGGWQTSFSTRGAYLLTQIKDSVRLAASNPAQSSWSGTVTVARADTKGGVNCTVTPNSLTFNLVTPPSTGASVVITC